MDDLAPGLFTPSAEGFVSFIKAASKSIYSNSIIKIKLLPNQATVIQEVLEISETLDNDTADSFKFQMQSSLLQMNAKPNDIYAFAYFDNGNMIFSSVEEPIINYFGLKTSTSYVIYDAFDNLLQEIKESDTNE